MEESLVESTQTCVNKHIGKLEQHLASQLVCCLGNSAVAQMCHIHIRYRLQVDEFVVVSMARRTTILRTTTAVAQNSCL